SDYYEKYNSSSPFSFTKGQSYWIIRKGNLAVNQTVPGARVNGSGYTDIPLSGGGFNLITNPYTEQVLWPDVLAANGLPAATPLNSFSTSGWGTSQNMQPYVGYLFDNANDLSSLRIPYPILTSPLLKSDNLDLWRVNVHLECNEFLDENTSFGVSLEANEARDKYDFRKPRSPGNIPMVYFYHPDWDDGYGLFAADIRPQFTDIQEWDLSVDSKLRETIKLTFDGQEDVPDDMEIYLLDIDRSYSINLGESTEYSFTPVKDHSQLKIVVGKSEKVNLVLNNLMPTEFILGNNFPNPFNPSTTIQVSVPNTSDIKLIVYNILGQEIRVLFEGISAPGNHWFEWNGKDQQGLSVPSGVYIYTLRTSTGINISKKMVLMK
ncbi:MAG: T9SS type A sorting domain-containing protein, partial [Ignavibacteriaceae bacterium]|nr:T9SS type A sorting domain-containing protein [Ignavibacteriaceae bacterium]